MSLLEQYTIFMTDTPIPTIVIDDTPVKRRGICDFVEETPQLRLHAQAGDVAGTMRLIEKISEEELQNPTLAGWLVLSDLRLGNDNGVELGRSLLAIAAGLRVEYTKRGMPRSASRGAGKQPGLHGYALFNNIDPTYLEHIATTVVRRDETFIDPEVLNYLLKKLRGQQLTPRQEECASLIARGLSNDDIALHMGFLNARGGPNMGPLENLVSELYSFFAIDGAPSDPGRRVLLAHAYEAYVGLRPE